MRWREVLYLVAVLAVAAVAYTLLYACSDDSCRARGGHTELVYGGRGGWVCEGATR